MKAAWDHVNCGREFRNFIGKKIASKKVGEEKPTHVDYISTFDPEVDEVTGNRYWKDSGNLRAMAFFDARVLRNTLRPEERILMEAMAKRLGRKA